jgi:hypothetical protein
MIVSLRKLIPSGSHNARFDEANGYHWPAGEQFTLYNKSGQKRLRKYHRWCKTDAVFLTQVDGEQVTISIPENRLDELFGVSKL